MFYSCELSSAYFCRCTNQDSEIKISCELLSSRICGRTNQDNEIFDFTRTILYLSATLIIISCYNSVVNIFFIFYQKIVVTLLLFTPRQSSGNHAPKCLPFSILCAKSVIIHTSITYNMIKTGVGVNCNQKSSCKQACIGFLDLLTLVSYNLYYLCRRLAAEWR